MAGKAPSQRLSPPAPVIALMLGITSALFFFAFIHNDLSVIGEWNGKDLGLILRYVLAMALGGGVTGFLLAGLFGRQGILGWVLALFVGVLATLLAGVIGSTLGLAPDLLADGWQSSDMIAILAGLLILPFAIGSYPWLIPVWFALIAFTHFWARSRRSQLLLIDVERQSFNALR